MKCDPKTGKRIRYPGELIKCKDCNKLVRRASRLKGAPQRCHKCRVKFLVFHPEHSSTFKTGRARLTNGYITVVARGHPNAHKAKRRMLEHRLVMERKLGRYLKPTEFVHHLNGRRDDNRPSNLVVCKSFKEHASYHITRKPCMICSKPHEARGFCAHHYYQWKRNGATANGFVHNGKRFKPLPALNKGRNANSHKARKSLVPF